jgi:hypothetical protein
MQLESILVLSGIGVVFVLFICGVVWGDIQTKLAKRQEEEESQFSSRRS